jgi:1-acyl-sn-glycerol-3-phosphate acyltransferase
MKRITGSGPMIIAINHINFLEVPVIQTELYPRIMRGMVKQETWKNPAMHFLLDTYRAIPVFRGGANLSAFRSAADTLKRGDFICIAPEGTRSGTGILQEGKAGLAHLALLSGSLIQPVVHHGGENFWKNLKHFRRTPFILKVGRPFRLKTEGRTTAEIREVMTREIMYQLAELLPEELRGPYSDLSAKSAGYIEFCGDQE